VQELSYTFDADPGQGRRRRSHVGVVGSGDLEVLYRPADSAQAKVRVRTSVDGFDTVWTWVLQRFFTRHPLPGEFELNDFGATPGVVNLRLRQVAEGSRS
jgi:malonate decarboxylase acyl carrier protein